MRGLSIGEVENRRRAGKVNLQVNMQTKSYSQILFNNIVNYFNILNFILAIFIFFSGQYKNMVFMLVVLSNTAIAIYQEFRAKKLVDELTILSKNKIKVIRDGKKIELDQHDLVVDDLISVENGDQIPVDCILLDGNLEMDESNLTGESEPVNKQIGDYIYSASFAVGGSAILRVDKVGADSYANRISSQVKAEKIYPSKLRDTMNSILKIVTYAIIPIAILLFVKNKYIFHYESKELILKTTAPLVGVIPEGLILLTSIALAVSIYALGKKKILVQELYTTESLARVDVLCADKTGTITEGRMEVTQVIGDITDIMPSYMGAFSYENASDKALIKYFGKRNELEILSKVDFSSRRKYSSVTFKDLGTYALGAFEVLVQNPKQKDQDQIDNFTKKGLRVLCLVHFKDQFADKVPNDGQVKGFIVISDIIRNNTKELFEFFKKEGVAIKIISGDNPVAVGAIAAKAGLEDVLAIDVSSLDNEELKKATL